jgi:hypothetical protein
MATTKRPGVPYVWCSWLVKALAGESQCLYQPWLKAHFKYDKRPDTTFNLAAWTAEHDALVQTRAKELRSQGWIVTLERQNALKLQGKTAILAGQPDLVAVRDGDTLVVDGKTGQQRHADWWQVLIYMLILPRVREDLVGLRGEVCYKDHRIAVEPHELTTARAESIYALVREVAATIPLPTMPSQKECAWCDIADCQARYVETGHERVLVSEF